MGLNRPIEHPSSVGMEALGQQAIPQKPGLMTLMEQIHYCVHNSMTHWSLC